MNGAHLFGITLQVTAHEGEVLVDPDEEAAAEELLTVATAHHYKCLAVLGPDRIEQLSAVSAAALPVGPDEGDGAGVLVVVSEGDAVGEQGAYRTGIGAIFNRQ
jgi:hypothetical protein